MQYLLLSKSALGIDDFLSIFKGNRTTPINLIIRRNDRVKALSQAHLLVPEVRFVIIVM